MGADGPQVGAHGGLHGGVGARESRFKRSLGALGVRPGVLRLSSIHFLAALVLLFVSSPFIEGPGANPAVEIVTISVVMLAGVLAVGGRTRTLVWAIALAAPTVGARWVEHVWPGTIHPGVQSAGAVAFLAFVVSRLLAFVLRAPRVDMNVLCAGLAGYLTLALLWGTLYILVARLTPDAFAFLNPRDGGMAGFTALYFSVVTLTTVGFGDITPVSGVARMLAMMEAMTGTLYIAVFISRLVAVYTSTRPEAAGPGGA